MASWCRFCSIANSIKGIMNMMQDSGDTVYDITNGAYACGIVSGSLKSPSASNNTSLKVITHYAQHLGPKNCSIGNLCGHGI
ncbi:uncharacterized protein EI90DRAFT_3078794 [Cantharellus anzutake]|uniref:uncharacterized protein n=1 Tax=Cantharellus anzutake TaxID=1750568 RepID=UPI0019057EEE|nr:uncharacterized protein EI90DRAFT_3078794 [Cantharellus anzutake]KAF8321839.1 hypothetical protein EI90DRAFT_3078794 [Cantharellus anzutake]